METQEELRKAHEWPCSDLNLKVTGYSLLISYLDPLPCVCCMELSQSAVKDNEVYQLLWPKLLKVGSRNWIQITSPENTFEGLKLKINTYLRAAQGVFCSTCQELLDT